MTVTDHENIIGSSTYGMDSRGQYWMAILDAMSKNSESSKQQSEVCFTLLNKFSEID